MGSIMRYRWAIILSFALLISLLQAPSPTSAQAGAECLNIASSQVDSYTPYPALSWWKLYYPRTQQLTSDHRVNQGIPVLSPDGQYAVYFELFPLDVDTFTTRAQEIVLRILRQSDSQVIFERKSQGLPPELKWSPDSRWLWITGLTDKVRGTLIEIATGTTVEFENKVTASFYDVWSRDSKYLLMFSLTGDSHMQSTIYLWSVEQQTTLEIASQVLKAGWDPTGTYLVFWGINTATQPYLGIYTAATAATGDLKFYPRPGVQNQMHWSPSGRYLVFDGRIFDPTKGELLSFGAPRGLDTQLETVYFSPDESIILYSSWGASTVWRADMQTGEVLLLLNRFTAYDQRGLLWLSSNSDQTVSIEMPTGDGWTKLVDDIKPMLDAAFAGTATASASTPALEPTAAAATATARVEAFTHANPTVIRGSIGYSYANAYVSPDSRVVAATWAEVIAPGRLRWNFHWALADEGFRQVHKLVLYESIDLATMPQPQWFTDGDFILFTHPQADGHDVRIINLRTGDIAAAYDDLALTVRVSVDSEQENAAAAVWWQDSKGTTGIDVYDSMGARVAQLDTSSMATNISWNTTVLLIPSPQGQFAAYWNGLLGMPNSSWALQLFDKAGHATQLLSRPDAELYPRAIQWIPCP